ncbi:hypothetical protein TNCV_4429351 [Trichonephila clavipes]|nr:hypothetical protein TNCV_4429351 [Trichonephila clavipes]
MRRIGKKRTSQSRTQSLWLPSIQTDSWSVCHFKLSTAEDSLCRGDRVHVEAQMFSRWCGEEVRRGVPAQVSSSSLDHDSKL